MACQKVLIFRDRPDFTTLLLISVNNDRRNEMREGRREGAEGGREGGREGMREGMKERGREGARELGTSPKKVEAIHNALRLQFQLQLWYFLGLLHY